MLIYSTRNDFIKSLPEKMSILEIGVFKGEFSEVLLSTNPTELTLLDVFEGVANSGDKDGLNMQSTDMGIEYLNLHQKFSNYPVSFLKGYSHQILPTLPVSYFDLVYIDADHFNPNFRNDLLNSLLITKPTGIIAGHDFNANEYPDIVHEVNRLIQSGIVTLEYFTEDRLPSFGLRKTCAKYPSTN